MTALDNSFLVLEKPNAYMHVASTGIFEAGPLRTPEGGIDADAIKDLTARLLHLIPRYRQKLAWIPFENHAVWIDDDRFNLDYHVRHTSLPQPGDARQLKRLSARIMQQHLDRSRPLWEMWVVEGLESDRWALISKVHHCMVDGVSGVDLMRILMSATPDHSIPDAPAFIPRPAPGAAELMRNEWLRRLGLPLTLARGIGHLAGEARDTRRSVLVRLRAAAEQLGGTLRPPSDTPLNAPIGPHRRFDWIATPITEIKEVRKALGGSLNDVVLTVVTGAVRRFLRRRSVNPKKIDFRVMTPVSVRSAEEAGALGNRVSAWIVELPVAEADPRVQLRRIARRTAELKESKQAVGAEMLTQVAEWTPSTLLALGARNATRLLPFNMVVTNVPGPQVPMYMLGSRMLEVYPHVPLVDHLGLGIALMSYDGTVYWGFNADYELLPDLHDFVEDTEEAFGELRDLADEARAKEAPERTPAKPKARPRSPRKPSASGSSRREGPSDAAPSAPPRTPPAAEPGDADG